MIFVNCLFERGAEVRAFDPVVPTKYDFKVNTQEDALKGADLIVVLTKQHEIILDDMEKIYELTNEKAIFVDMKGIADKDECEKVGFTYWRI